MRAPRPLFRACAAFALGLATLGLRPVPHVRAIPAGPKPLAAAVVLAKYAAALRALERPNAISFDYAVEQLGLRNMEQTHHVYRSGLNERDETTIVDGYELRRPSVRIIANRTYRYDIAAVAPTPSAYRFVFNGAVARGSSFDYVFGTSSLAARPFAVTEVEIDGTRFLPSVLRFKIVGGDARGSGRLGYAAEGRYWIVRDAQVSAHLASGATAHERIAWSNYSFPSALPPSTFAAPSAHASEEFEPRTVPGTL